MQETNDGYEILLQKDMGKDNNPLIADAVEFTNTYTANTKTIPATGDSGVMLLCGTLMIVSFSGRVIACLQKRKRMGTR